MAEQKPRNRRPERAAAVNAAAPLWAAVDAGHVFIQHGSNVVTGPRRLLVPGAVLTAETWRGAVEVKVEAVVSDRRIDGFDIRTATYVDGSEHPWVIALTKLTEPQKTAIHRAQYESEFGAIPADTDPQDIGRLAEFGLIKEGYGRWPWVLTAGGCSAAFEVQGDRETPAQPAQTGQEPVRVMVTVEAHPREEEAEFDAAEWASWTPERRRQEINDAVWTVIANAGGAGFRFLSGATEDDLSA